MVSLYSDDFEKEFWERAHQHFPGRTINEVYLAGKLILDESEMADKTVLEFEHRPSAGGRAANATNDDVEDSEDDRDVDSDSEEEAAGGEVINIESSDDEMDVEEFEEEEEEEMGVGMEVVEEEEEQEVDSEEDEDDEEEEEDQVQTLPWSRDERHSYLQTALFDLIMQTKYNIA